MRAVRFHTFGDASTLRLDEVTQPTPGPGEALVKVAGTSFNLVDVVVRSGELPDVFPVELPHTPGIDLAGTVVAVGPDAPDSLVGTDVIALLPITAPGASAEYVTVAADLLAPAPSTVPLADAAALPAVGLTAWQAIDEHAGLKSGQRILVNGAGGGVGGFAVQLAVARGATVVATAGPRSADAVRAAGATQVVDYTATPVTAAGLEPFDVVLNLVRNEPAEVAELVALVKPGGVFVSTTTPGEEDADRKVRATRIFLHDDPARLAELAKLVDAGTLRLDVSARYPLADLRSMQEAGERGELRGKAVLQVS